jgi:hypothetical protein
VIQVIECLPSKREALSSNSTTAKEKKAEGVMGQKKNRFFQKECMPADTLILAH